jgi:hypothetical protein
MDTQNKLSGMEANLMRVIYRVPDKLTTRSRHDKKSKPVDQLQFCPQHVHDLFATDFYSNMFDLVVNLSRTSREVGSPTLGLQPNLSHPQI